MNPNELAEENEKIDLKNVVNKIVNFLEANNIIDYRLMLIGVYTSDTPQKSTNLQQHYSSRRK